MIYCYNRSQRAALFLKLIWQRTLHVSADLLSIIRILNTVYTAIGICHGSYDDYLLAVASRSLVDSQNN